MKRVILFALPIALALTACDITVRPSQPVIDRTFLEANAVTVSATNDPTSIVASGDNVTSTTTGSDFYKISFNGLPSEGEIIYFEAYSNDVELTLYNARGEAVLESNSNEFFGYVGQGLTVNSLDNQSIASPRICRGSCIIVDRGYGTVYLQVKSRTTTPTAYAISIYHSQYSDSTEPNNDACVISTASILPASINVIPVDDDPFIAAIETVKDIDCFANDGYITSVTLNTFDDSTINLQVRILTPDGRQVKDENGNDAIYTFGKGSTLEIPFVSESQILLEITPKEGRAAAAAYSKYTVDFVYSQ